MLQMFLIGCKFTKFKITSVNGKRLSPDLDQDKGPFTNNMHTTGAELPTTGLHARL